MTVWEFLVAHQLLVIVVVCAVAAGVHERRVERRERTER